MYIIHIHKCELFFFVKRYVVFLEEGEMLFKLMLKLYIIFELVFLTWLMM